MPGIRVVRFVCDALGRYPNISKIIEIMEWSSSNDVSEARIFIKVTVYYRVFVKNFAFIAAPIYALIRKGVRFA